MRALAPYKPAKSPDLSGPYGASANRKTVPVSTRRDRRNTRDPRDTAPFRPISFGGTPANTIQPDFLASHAQGDNKSTKSTINLSSAAFADLTSQEEGMLHLVLANMDDNGDGSTAGVRSKIFRHKKDQTEYAAFLLRELSKRAQLWPNREQENWLASMIKNYVAMQNRAAANGASAPLAFASANTVVPSAPGLPSSPPNHETPMRRILSGASAFARSAFGAARPVGSLKVEALVRGWVRPPNLAPAFS